MSDDEYMTVTLKLPIRDIEQSVAGEYEDGGSSLGEAVMAEMVYSLEKTIAKNVFAKSVATLQPIIDTKMEQDASNIILQSVATKLSSTNNDGVNILDAKIDALIDGALKERSLNSSGAFVGLGKYGAKFSVIEYMASERVNAIFDKKIAVMMTQTLDDAKKHIEDQVRVNFAQQLTDFFMANQGAISLTGLAQKKDG